MGCVGMGYDDFCRCTPSQFLEILSQWEKRQTALSRERWEQARFIATSCLQPYSRKALKPSDVARFDWDGETDPAPAEESTYERFRALVDARAAKK